MQYTAIEFRTENHIATITLNRPEALNTLNGDMVREIGEALQAVEGDGSSRVVVLTGAGKAFCAGADLKYVQRELTTPGKEQAFFRWANKTLMEGIERLAQPVIAAVNGATLGGGYELMMACDLVVAADEAVIGDQHLNYGLIGPGGSTQRTAWLVGARKAKEIIFTGKRLSGKEAERIGLVNASVPRSELESTVTALATELAKKSPVALRIAKMLINRANQVDGTLASELEVMSVLVNNASEDHAEGMRAFAEGRAPLFSGR